MTDSLQKVLKEKGIDSMLEDARNDMKDTDAELLVRRGKFVTSVEDLFNLPSKPLTCCRDSIMILCKNRENTTSSPSCSHLKIR